MITNLNDKHCWAFLIACQKDRYKIELRIQYQLPCSGTEIARVSMKFGPVNIEKYENYLWNMSNSRLYNCHAKQPNYPIVET